MIPGKFVCLVLMAILLTRGGYCQQATGNQLLDAVRKAFDDESLESQVMQSCINHTKAVLAYAENKVLEELKPLSESCTGVPEQDGEYFDVMGTGKKEWRLAFRGTARINQPVYPAYQSSQQGVNVENACKQIGNTEPCNHHYRNDDALDNWQGIAEVAFVLYNHSDKLRQIVFDATGTNYLNWFQKSKVMSSSWKDLLTAPQNYFSIEGYSGFRRFFINSNYGGCENDAGWFVAIDKATPDCGWEQIRVNAYPVFLYSNSARLERENWTTGDIGEADTMAIFLKYQLL